MKKHRSHKGTQSVESAIHSIKEELKKEDKTLHEGLEYIKKHLDKLWEHVAETNERLIDLEVQSNLMTRLVTTICIERLKIHADALTKLIRRVEKEAIDDSQIMHLEQLYNLEHEEEKKTRNKHKHPREEGKHETKKPKEEEPPSI